jgi:hypothetical protein
VTGICFKTSGRISHSSFRTPRSGDPGSSSFALEETKTLDYARLLPRALRANGFAVVRFGILPAQSRFRGNDARF